MQELALMYLRKALEEALKAGGNTLLDELFQGLTEKQIDALIRDPPGGQGAEDNGESRIGTPE